LENSDTVSFFYLCLKFSRMKPVSSIVFYYFSGTGNSRKVVSWLEEVAHRHQVAVVVHDIARQPLPPPAPDDLVVICSPVHGFNYPPLVLGFLRRFPRGKNPVMLMNTRAGMLIGRWVTPGLSGVAFLWAALMLWLKGYTIRGMHPVDMPSNWISVHPGLNQRTVKFLHEVNKTRVTRLAEKIVAGRTDFKALRELVQDLLVAPIALAYYFIGRFVIAKTYYASSDCDLCGLCMKNCPAGAIRLVDGRPFWTFRCESCMRCMSYCPKKAVETAHGLVGVVVLAYSALTTLLFDTLVASWWPGIPEVVTFVAEWSLFALLMATGYRLLHFALRWKPVERLILVSSLTWYRFWGRRYRALRN
jgi:NAD-dependent dihydropyrimidine dehydrogenase PreA subunit